MAKLFYYFRGLSEPTEQSSIQIHGNEGIALSGCTLEGNVCLINKAFISNDENTEFLNELSDRLAFFYKNTSSPDFSILPEHLITPIPKYSKLNVEFLSSQLLRGGHGSRMVVEGSPGSGKGHLGLRLLHDWALRWDTRFFQLVLYLDFRKLGQQSIEEALLTILLKVKRDDELDSIKRSIKKSAKHFLLIFDNYDTSYKKLYEEFVRGDFFHSNILFTTREWRNDIEINKDSKFKICNFELKELFAAFAKQHNQSSSEAFDTLESMELIEDFAISPKLCYLAYSVLIDDPEISKRDFLNAISQKVFCECPNSQSTSFFELGKRFYNSLVEGKDPLASEDQCGNEFLKLVRAEKDLRCILANHLMAEYLLDNYTKKYFFLFENENFADNFRQAFDIDQIYIFDEIVPGCFNVIFTTKGSISLRIGNDNSFEVLSTFDVEIILEEKCEQPKMQFRMERTDGGTFMVLPRWPFMITDALDRIYLLLQTFRDSITVTRYPYEIYNSDDKLAEATLTLYNKKSMRKICLEFIDCYDVAELLNQKTNTFQDDDEYICSGLEFKTKKMSEKTEICYQVIAAIFTGVLELNITVDPETDFEYLLFKMVKSLASANRKWKLNGIKHDWVLTAETFKDVYLERTGSSFENNKKIELISKEMLDEKNDDLPTCFEELREPNDIRLYFEYAPIQFAIQSKSM